MKKLLNILLVLVLALSLSLIHICHRAHIAATGEDKALAIRFLDLFYREDYAVQANYGSFTIGSVRRADGTYGVLVPEGYADEEWQRLNSVVDNGVYYFSEELESRVTPTDSTLQLLRDCLLYTSRCV